jgi:hypothetical protein
MKKVQKGISVFDGKHKRFGGHNQWMSRLLRIDYLFLQFGWFKPSYDHEWYDGQHHWFSCGPIRVCWGSKPLKDK